MDILTFFFNIILLTSFIISLMFLGSKVSLKILNRRTEFSIIFGFMAFCSVFYILNLVPLLYNFSFNFVKFVDVPLFFAFNIWGIYNFFRFEYRFLKSRYNEKYYIIVDIVSILYGVYLFLFSTTEGDSYLFMRLATISSTSGQIYSNDFGNSIVNSIHATDSYYLFQNMLAWISNMDPYIYVASFLKFLEGFIVVQMFGFLSQVIVPKVKLQTFIILFLGIFLWVCPLSNAEWGQFLYPQLFLVNMSPTGTSLLYFVALPMFLIYLCITDIKSNKLLFLLLIGFFGFSVSSSFLYIFAIFIFVVMLLDVFVYKKFDDFRYYIASLYLVIFNFLMFFIFEKNDIIFWILSLLALFIFYIIFRFFDKRWFYISVTVLSIAAFVLLFIFCYLSKDINFSTDSIGSIMSYSRTIFYGLGIYYLYKSNKRIFYFIIFSTIIFCNQFSETVFANDVYHRIEMIGQEYLFNVFGLIFLLEFFSLSKKIFLYIILAISFLLSSIFLPEGHGLNIDSYKGYDSFYEYKIRNKDIYHFSQYNFNEEAFIVVPTDEMTKVYQVNPLLVPATSCSQNCYEIKPSDEVTKEEIVVDESGIYSMIYVE